MHKIIWSTIGLAVAAVILVMAYRIFDGAGGSAKVGEIEVKVDSRKDATKTSDTAKIIKPKKKKITKQFTRSFDFENHSCGTNTDTSVQRCVDAGYTLSGMVGNVSYTSKDTCGSNFISFNKTSESCGDFKVHLQGCGFTSIKTCKGHAYIKGNFALEGFKYE